jgi:hypothetical protein
MAAAAPILVALRASALPAIAGGGWPLTREGASCQQPHSIAIAADDQPVGKIFALALPHPLWRACRASPRRLLTGAASRGCPEPNLVPSSTAQSLVQKGSTAGQHIPAAV